MSVVESQILHQSDEAANELWDRIQNSSSCLPSHNDQSSTYDQFVETQRNRTLYHPTLKQPTVDDEALFLQKLPTQNDVLNKDAEDELKARLTAALYGSQKYSPEGQHIDISQENSINKILDDNGPSPTSTLCFPDSSKHTNDIISSNSDHLYCSFIKEELQPNDEAEYNCEDQDCTTQLLETSGKFSSNSVPHSSSELESHSRTHRFVVCADPQLGMTTLNREWETEIEYCKAAVKKLNSLRPRPKFACICGDMVDMEESFYYNNPNGFWNWDKSVVDRVRKQQIQDFKDIFSQLHSDIALVCVCGNHDVGIRPTLESITKYKKDFGDEYLAFWTNGTYNIVLNNVLFNNPDGAPDIFQEQLEWLEERLQYANKFRAAQIYVYAHHPWFLYHEDDEDADLRDRGIPFPDGWLDETEKYKGFVMTDDKFCVPKKMRNIALNLFRQYNVSACFCGHFHQNVVRKTSWGMDMIVTGPISMILESTGNQDALEKGRGIRIVDVFQDHTTIQGEVDAMKIRRVGGAYFTHRFENF